MHWLFKISKYFIFYKDIQWYLVFLSAPIDYFLPVKKVSEKKRLQNEWDFHFNDPL